MLSDNRVRQKTDSRLVQVMNWFMIEFEDCLERYKKMLGVNPSEARYTDKVHHDVVVQNLVNNIDIV